jgi:hypothetical protein
VGLGVRELEQRGEGLQPVGQSCVAGCIHLDSVFNVASIVIPFRGEDAKQRLPEQIRAELARAMLADVLAAADEIGRTIVAEGRGQGAAVETALSDVQETPVLVVNADLPAVTPRDLLALLGSAWRRPGSSSRSTVPAARRDFSRWRPRGSSRSRTLRTTSTS